MGKGDRKGEGRRKGGRQEEECRQKKWEMMGEKGEGKREMGRGDEKGEGRRREQRGAKGVHVGRRECVLLVSSVSGLFVSSLKLRPLSSPPVHSSQREDVQLEGARLFE